MSVRPGLHSEPVAVLLAAGTGSRLGGRLKALFPLKGRPLIDHCIEALVDAAVGRLLIVTGHAADSLKAHLRAMDVPIAIDCVHNPHYRELNNFYSLRVGCAVADGPLLVLNSDIIFMRELVELVRDGEGSLRLAVERDRTDAEALKAHVTGGRVHALGKNLDPASAFGEFIGISGMSDDVRRRYVAAADEALTRGEATLYYEDVYGRLCASLDARAVEVPGGTWAEIDCPDDVRPAALVAANRAREAVVA